MEAKLAEMKAEALRDIASAKDARALYDLKVKYFGKTGSFAAFMKNLAQVPPAEKPKWGKLINDCKTEVEGAYNLREKDFQKGDILARVEKETIDLSLPGPEIEKGNIHPLAKVVYEITDILSRMGYSVRTGPMIERDWYNFEALNIPPDHPARDMQDTFYIDPQHVLRTHTSPIQIRTLEKEKLPLRILAPGGVYRCDSDGSHSPNFHQIEGLLVDKKVSMADLKGTISFFVREFFGRNLKVRFRPSFFPFTEPSAEMDCSCPLCEGKGCRLCGQSGWLEIGGCGLVNPRVFEAVKIDPQQWQGFAFGFGIERMAIVKYGVEDIRLFFDNDIRFLEQFTQ